MEDPPAQAAPSPSLPGSTLRIAHVIPSFYPALVYGGPTESTYQLCRHLAQQDCMVRVLTTNANGRSAVLEVETRQEVRLSDRLLARYCRRLFPDSVSPALLHHLPSYVRWADVVHLSAVYSFPTIPTLVACKILRKPVVWSPRGSLQRWERTTRPWIKSLWESVCSAAMPGRVVFHVTSEEEAEDSLLRFPNLEAVVIPNGVEIPSSVSPRRTMGILRLLYIGRLHPIKGIDNLLEACRVLKSKGSVAFTLVIAGSGEARYEEVLRSQAGDMIETGHVKMVGMVVGRAKEDTFGNADLVVVPSHTENFGMVVAESLAHGKPVIASRGTPWRRVEEIDCGLWVENDPQSLVRAIENLAGRSLEEMGGRGRQWIEREFTWSAVAEKMKRLYLQVVDPVGST